MIEQKELKPEANNITELMKESGVDKEVKVNEAKHGLHLNHWSAGEFYALLIQHFSSVIMYSVDKLETWNISETIDGNSTDYLVVAKVEG